MDARPVRAERRRFRRGALDALERANHLTVPSGRRPASGLLLLDRASYDRIDPYSNTNVLYAGDAGRSDCVGPILGLSVVRAQCATRGLAADPSALYLVEVTDNRGILANRWFRAPMMRAYNLRAPAYPDTFQLASMQDYPAGGAGSKTTWTWSSMIQDMWLSMPLLGPWPGLPATPLGTPEGFRFDGVGAWDALCGVLDHLGLVVAADLQRGDPYTIVGAGAGDAGLVFLQGRYGAPNSPNYCLEDDLEWIDLAAGRVPLRVVVLFRRRNAVYGTEETVARQNDAAAQQWDMKSYYAVTVPAPAMFAAPIGEHYIWSDFTVRYDQDSNPLGADVALATAIAQERVGQYFARIYGQASGTMTQVYAGALPFTTGSLVDEVCWYLDPDGGGGWRTRISRGSARKAHPW